MQLEGSGLYDVVVRRDAFAHSADLGIYQASGQGVTHPHPCTAYQLCCTELQTNTFCNLDKSESEQVWLLSAGVGVDWTPARSHHEQEISATAGESTRET